MVDHLMNHSWRSCKNTFLLFPLPSLVSQDARKTDGPLERNRTYLFYPRTEMGFRVQLWVLVALFALYVVFHSQLRRRFPNSLVTVI